MFEGLKNRIARCNDKAEKSEVYRELNTFAQESWIFRNKKSTVRILYRAALADPLAFRRALRDAVASEHALLTGDCDLPVSATEERYYRQRGLPVPPLF